MARWGGSYCPRILTSSDTLRLEGSPDSEFAVLRTLEAKSHILNVSLKVCPGQFSQASTSTTSSLCPFDSHYRSRQAVTSCLFRPFMAIEDDEDTPPHYNKRNTTAFNSRCSSYFNQTSRLLLYPLPVPFMILDNDHDMAWK